MDLLERIDAIIDRKHLLQHSFYKQWMKGTLPPKALQDYACQYFSFESSFPRFLSALHARIDRPELRRPLLENLWDEEHGDANHRELWLQFAEGVGTARERVEATAANAATRALVDTYARAATEAPIAAGVAALYAYERQLPAVAAAKIEGLATRYGIDDARTLAFFRTHATIDVGHADAERAIVRELGVDDEDAVARVASEALDAWWRFLDAVDPSA